MFFSPLEPLIGHVLQEFPYCRGLPFFAYSGEVLMIFFITKVLCCLHEVIKKVRNYYIFHCDNLPASFYYDVDIFGQKIRPYMGLLQFFLVLKN